MTRTFGGDPVQEAVQAAMEALEWGRTVPERRLFDFKEDAGRRHPRTGNLTPGMERSERAANSLAPAVACMANSAQGGALIVGVADDLSVMGTDLDPQWLQVRLYELLHRELTTLITIHEVRQERVLVIRCPPSIRPIAINGRAKWRVGDQCVDIDPGLWHEHRRQSSGFDWSGQPSSVTMDDVRGEAMAIARRFLRASGDESAGDLATATDADLVRRLGVVTNDGHLSNAGAILFVGHQQPALDYIRRAAAGADSEARVCEGSRSLLEELDEVFTTARAYNPETHVQQGLVIGQTRQLPERALREAVVNGVAHREWPDPAPTVVEHAGATLRVTSPGAFYGTVSSENIINHPSVSRNAALAGALGRLRIAERQGIGVDRMFGDMLRRGHPAPTIVEQDGARVLTVLAGERPDIGWMRWLSSIDPAAADDLRLLMCLHRLVTLWWTDAEDLASYLQITAPEAHQVAAQARTLTIDGQTVVRDVAVRAPREAVLTVTAAAWRLLQRLSRAEGTRRGAPTRAEVALAFARHAGRISTTELGSIVGAAASNMGTILRGLEDDGLLAPSRTNRRGPGFYYRYVGP